MSIHGLVCSPSTIHFCAQELPFSPPSFSSLYKSARPSSLLIPPTLSLRNSPLLLPFPLTPKTPRFHVLQATAPLSEAIGRTEDVQSGDEAPGNRVLAQNVPWNSTADDLRPLFEKYGTVVDIELSMYNKSRNRGLAFVTMGSHEEAVAALTNLDSYEFEGRILKLNWATPKRKKPSSPPVPKPIYNLFVANLPFQARAKDLREFFNADNGNVASAEVIFLEDPRRSAGYGFVSFNTKEAAEAALLAFEGKEFMGRPIRVARSKMYLREQTKLDIQSQSAPSESNPEGE
ncbi:31 kDa ribonucleoprotein, chloroplastic [Ipomoea triloba]|uniref:31 kDa ribonucleoprotein, chloroplastic n=1 Tax=Ipomoea triloba TaxID=35885 RepID=UPI00125E8FCD|nr:31 kDa ribonucleoprotein, chloroplastic [Ipomoea triloba]